jgi:hypothetical protein
MARPSLEEVATQLSAVRCAICKTNEFWVDLRTLQADGECKGVCKKCRYNFPIHTDMEFYLRTQPDVPYAMKTIPCPQCHTRGVDLDFRIVLSVREAYYFVRCRACQHPFTEKSSMESFE